MRLREALAMFLLAVSTSPRLLASSPSEIRWALHSEPRTLDPALVEDEASEAVRYLTQGVLLRVNRKTQALEPELAKSWQVSSDGRSITFRLRESVRFSDGSPLTAADVMWSVQHVLDPATHSPEAQSFGTLKTSVEVRQSGPGLLTFRFPEHVVGLAAAFDAIAIEHAGTATPNGSVVLGPYVLARWDRGSSLTFKRNPYYWKHDAQGQRLPYIDQVRLVIQQNRDLELAQYLRGDLQLINAISPEQMRVLSGRPGSGVLDLGPSFDSEQLWFNQADTAPLPAYKKQWFHSQDFRNALSMAINRQDLVRIALDGHGIPARGPISPANRMWFNAKLAPVPFDLGAAQQLLARAGFKQRGQTLYDAQGHAVQFSLLTNAGNPVREKIAVLLQQDLAKLGIEVRLVTLDFPALISRITKTFDYDACLLGLVNVDADPNSQMNLWLSSSPNHQWNPEERTPATQWEAEIDSLMQVQATATNQKARKQAIDRFQEIVREQEPFIYLVNRNALAAVSPGVSGADPAVSYPQTFWRIEWMRLSSH